MSKALGQMLADFNIEVGTAMTPPIPDVPYIKVIFCKGSYGWMPFIGYGCDIDTKTTVEFIEQINKAADVLNKKGGEDNEPIQRT